MANGNTNSGGGSKVPGGAFIAAAFLGVGIYVVNAFTKKAKDDAAAAASVVKAVYWSPTWFGSSEGGKYNRYWGLDPVVTLNLIKQIYDNINISYAGIPTLIDDAAKITAALRTLKYQTQVSYLAAAYSSAYKTDLADTLINNLRSYEMNAITTYLNALPSGKSFVAS